MKCHYPRCVQAFSLIIVLSAGYASPPNAQPREPAWLTPLYRPESPFWRYLEVAPCGPEGNSCCPPYRGSGGGIVGPEHCNEGLGCDIASKTCVRPCGGPGQVCCDGPETIASGCAGLTCYLKQPMCAEGSCNVDTRRCSACGATAGAACCPPDPMIAVARCTAPNLGCAYSDTSLTTGVCQLCGAEEQVPCHSAGRCGPGLTVGNDGRCQCDPGALAYSAVSAGSGCAIWPDRRGQCSVLTTGLEMHDVRDTVAGLTQRFDACLEGVFGAAAGELVSDVDNPRIFYRTVIPEGTRTAQGVNYVKADHTVAASGPEGEAEPGGGTFAPDVAGSKGSIDDRLPQVPSRLGSLPYEGELVTVGLRVGKRPLNVAMEATDPQGRTAPWTHLRIRLNPDVFLVPVQVFVLHDADAPSIGGALSREAMLALFDRIPEETGAPWKSLDGNGQLQSANHPLGRLVLDGGSQPAVVDGRYVPDDVYAQCGIQFRLVNYSPLGLPGSELRQRGNLDPTQTVVRQLGQRVRESPRHIDGPLTVIFAPFCSDTDAGSFAGPPLGQALVSSALACVRYQGGGGTLTHELGHLLLATHDHVRAPCVGSDEQSNLMCAEEGGGLQITPDQCRRMREHLSGSSLGRFFP